MSLCSKLDKPYPFTCRACCVLLSRQDIRLLLETSQSLPYHLLGTNVLRLLLDSASTKRRSITSYIYVCAHRGNLHVVVSGNQIADTMRIISNILFILAFVEMWHGIYDMILYLTVAIGILLAAAATYINAHKEDCKQDDKDITL